MYYKLMKDGSVVEIHGSPVTIEENNSLRNKDIVDIISEKVSSLRLEILGNRYFVHNKMAFSFRDKEFTREVSLEEYARLSAFLLSKPTSMEGDNVYVYSLSIEILLSEDGEMKYLLDSSDYVDEDSLYFNEIEQFSFISSSQGREYFVLDINETHVLLYDLESLLVRPVGKDNFVGFKKLANANDSYTSDLRYDFNDSLSFISRSSVSAMQHTESLELIMETLRIIMNFRFKDFDLTKSYSEWHITPKLKEFIDLFQ